MTLAVTKTMRIILQTHRFYNRWCNARPRNVELVHFCPLNLQTKYRCVPRNSNGYTTLASLKVPKDDAKRLLDHLINAYLGKEITDFECVVKEFSVRNLIKESINIIESIECLSELDKEDADMKKLIEEERVVNEERLKEINDKIIDLVIKNLDKDRFDDIIMEINAGAGGQEAMLFAKELLDMYIGHLNYLGYNCDMIDLDDSEQGGIRHASIIVSGTNVFEKLRHEAGVHRVQRNPVTEKSGRIHTSTVLVAVLPQPNEIQVEINPKDLRVEAMKASGAGGQHVNSTNSAVRITHLPTGTVTECQVHRSQIKNRKLALAKLRAKIYEERLKRQLSHTSGMRKQQMGMGERNEKIRTYNYNQDRVTDHRISNGTLHNLKGFLEGGSALDSLHVKLDQDLKHKLLLESLKYVK